MYRSFKASPVSAAAALFAAILLLSLAACRKAEPEGSAPPPAAGVEMKLRTESALPSPAGSAAAGTRKPALPKPLPPPSIASARAFALAAPPGPLLPSDYSLGPLQDLFPGATEATALLEPVRAFLAALQEGRLAEESLLPDRRPILASLLSPLLAGPRPRTYRLGSLFREGDSALARLRLEAAMPEGPVAPERAPRAEGELRLRREGGIWYVEDLALDPAELAREAAAPSGAFEPGFASP